MEMIKANLPVFIIIAPLVVAFLLPTFARKLKFVENLVIFVQVLMFAGIGYLAYIVFSRTLGETGMSYRFGGWPAPWGIELKIGNLAVFFLLVIVSVGLPVALFSKGNLEKEIGAKERVTRFYVLFLLLCAAMAGMALTNDLFNVFVLVEVATLSCCGLVSSRNHPRAAEAAFTYLILATLGSALILGGIGFIYITTGHLNMGFASEGLGHVWRESSHVVWLSASFLLVGFGVKSALFPLHIWLPDAHSTAPSPASAILSGLAVKGYFICLLKFLYNVFGITLLREFGIDKILVIAGSISIIAGSLAAIKQKELKRRLAFSTVAQIGYIFLGLGLMNEAGFSGMLFYLASHAIIKSTLFLAAGAMINATGKSKINDLAGIGRKMPVTMAAFTVASLGLVGIPLFSGFIGKWNLLLGCFDSQAIFPIIVIIAGSVLCAAYLFPIIRIAYFEPSPKTELQDPGPSQKLAFVLLVSAIIILGVVPGPLLELAKRAATELMML